MNLKNKYGSWALITGASSGIGEEFAKRLGSEGINLVLIARRKERLEKLASDLKSKFNIEIIVIAVDLTTDNFLENIISATKNISVGILVNNAGIGSTGEFINADPNLELNLVKLNCLAPTIISHHFIPLMANNKKGAIIFLGSLVAFQPTPYMATYSASKVFNSYLGDALWVELKKYNIDVLSLNPGGTNTEFQRIASVNSGPMPRSAKDVVTTAFKALGKKPNVVDGWINKAMAVSNKFLPRKIYLTLTGIITYKFYQQKIKNPS